MSSNWLVPNLLVCNEKEGVRGALASFSTAFQRSKYKSNWSLKSALGWSGLDWKKWNGPNRTNLDWTERTGENWPAPPCLKLGGLRLCSGIRQIEGTRSNWNINYVREHLVYYQWAYVNFHTSKSEGKLTMLWYGDYNFIAKFWTPYVCLSHSPTL